MLLTRYIKNLLLHSGNTAPEEGCGNYFCKGQLLAILIKYQLQELLPAGSQALSPHRETRDFP